jgi:hypothetical protein
MRIYISGPISGKPDGNKPAFEHAAELIRSHGHDPVNPHDVCANIGKDALWHDYMRKDIKALLDCDAIVMLPGWEDSRGACLEHLIAEELRIKEYDM